MEPVLIARETVIKYFKRYEAFIIPVLKFFLGVYVFQKISGIGYVNAAVLPYLGAAASIPLSTLFGLVFALLPYTLSYVLLIALITVQFSANLEIAAVVFLFLLCILLFYARMAVKESVLIILTVIAFRFHVPYLIPLAVGMYFSLTAIVPVAIGVFIYKFTPVVMGLAVTAKTAGLSITEMPATFSEVYSSLLASLTAGTDWIFTAFIFAMVMIITHVVSRLSIDFAKEIALLLGCVLNIFGFIIAVLVAKEDFPFGGVIIGTLACAVLAECIRFFDAILDYQRAESVQFEDENNYYYVRVVPKVALTKKKRVVRRIRPQPEDEA